MDSQTKQPTSKFIDCTGHFYGSRVSKSGQYLNVYVVAEINGKAIRVCVPTSLQKKEGKPYALVQSTKMTYKGAVANIPLFVDKKKEEQKEKPEEKQAPLDETIPF